MRFSTIVASALALILATSTDTVLAQEIVAPEQACMTCIQASALKQSPSCDAETMSTFGFIGPGAFEKMTPKQKRCNCMLSINDDWIKACTFQDTCTNENAAYLRRTLINIKGDVRCVAAVGPEEPANTTTTATKPSATVATPVAVPTTTTTPTGSNGSVHLGTSCSKLIAGAALAIVSTIVLL
ncbi:hypothetical protein BG015_007475 [Linnemannia schmuckeri]|uniref:Uncharacterized protein n=1 Tax=Linnemannia schmuckeri TaxID=64567 RepID=A0A9P5RZ32_9FUNG|nr:hypothetical protein BG015_007475 [Linnemannia schmuckeri]